MIGKIIGIILLVVAIGVVVFIGGKELNLWAYKTYEPQMEDARRDVYENTNSFVKGKKQEISKVYLEYQRATTDEEKMALKNMLRMSLQDFDEDKYITDPTMLSFVKQMKY